MCPEEGKRSWTPSWLDMRITVGNLLVIVGFIGAIITAWMTRDSSIASITTEQHFIQQQQQQNRLLIQDAVQSQNKINADQDARWQLALVDLKTDIRELRHQIELMLDNRGGAR